MPVIYAEKRNRVFPKSAPASEYLRMKKTKIVIAGGSFAGLYAAKYLDKHLARRPDIDVVAGLLLGATQGLLERDEIVVCTVTGHGLKDPAWALKDVQGVEVVPTRVPVDAVTAANALGLGG